VGVKLGTVPLEREYLLHLLAAIINNVEPHNPPENVDWENLYKIAANHRLTNMVYYGVVKLNPDCQPGQSVMKKFYQDYKIGLAREAAQHIALEQILTTLEAHHMQCMSLKGSLIKYLYPQPDMRSMSDLDILLKAEQTTQVIRIMKDMGFTLLDKGGNHDSYHLLPFVRVEMHRRLMSENTPYSNYFRRTWDRAILQDSCRYTYQLSLEDAFIYIMTHLTKHFVSGGTGIRSILDIWIYNNHYRHKMDWDYMQTELEEIKLWEFTKTICRLGEIWFSNYPSNEFYSDITDFIFSSGVYGTKKNVIAAEINTSAKGKESIDLNKKYYWLKLFFPGINPMKIGYPFLRSLPFLLPICWLFRGVKCMLFKRKGTLQTIRASHSMSEEYVIRLRKIHKQAGLTK